MQLPEDLNILTHTSNDIVGSVFHQQWEPRGHTFGSCMTRYDTSWMYVNIPKCASSWTKPNLLDQQFKFYNYHYDHLYHKHALIVLRDPLERWLSGICEYFTLYHPAIDLDNAGRAFYELLLDQLTFDDHTEQQVYFIEGLDPKRCTFLMCDRDYSVFFAQWIRNQGIENKYQKYGYQHTTEGDLVRTQFKNRFKEFLQVPKYVNHIKSHYRLDYNLIENVQIWKG